MPVTAVDTVHARTPGRAGMTEMSESEVQWNEKKARWVCGGTAQHRKEF